MARRARLRSWGQPANPVQFVCANSWRARPSLNRHLWVSRTKRGRAVEGHACILGKPSAQYGRAPTASVLNLVLLPIRDSSAEATERLRLVPTSAVVVSATTNGWELLFPFKAVC